MNYKKKIFVFSLIFLLAGSIVMIAANREHVVRPGDTLYSISKAYGVTVEAIQAANPSIVGTTIPTGMKLIIPEAASEPEKKSQHAALSFTNKKEDKGKKNDDVKKDESKPAVSTPAATTTTIIGTTVGKSTPSINVKFENKPSLPTYNVKGDGHWTDGTLTLAVILPFNLNGKSVEEQKSQMRSVEFYQGVLMAVDEMQQTGRRVSVVAYDLGSESVSTILNDKNLLSADFIIGPMDENELKAIAEWGDSHGTPVVSPFVFSPKLLEQYSLLYQVNTQKSMLYPQLTEDLLDRFKKHTFVFLTDSVNSHKLDPYPSILKKELRKKGIAFKEMSYYHPEMLMACDSLLGIMDKDLIFVSETPQQESLRRMFSGLQHVKILREARFKEALSLGTATQSQPKIAVLGYPEWVLYTKDFVDYYYDLNVYMFSKLYINPFDPFVKRFYDNFKAWYNKEPMALMPKYGVLGYDITRYFLRSLTRHGQHISERIIGQEEDCLQNVFCFEKSETGNGFYNHGLYLVHFTTDSTIEKIIIK